MLNSHVFVVLGSLTRLNCDAWMLPTSRALSIRPSWRIDGVMEAVEQVRHTNFGTPGRMAMPLPGWPEHQPLPVLTSIPIGKVGDASDIGHPLTEFIRVASAESWKRWDREGDARQVRPRPLLGIPFFGSRGGGGENVKGELLTEILRVARIAARAADVDVALVLVDQNAFALAQVIRKREVTESWPHLAGTKLLDQAIELSEHARSGRLVPFMGAGVSVSAGAPGWGDLIDALALQADLGSEEREALAKSRLGLLDQAAYLRTVFMEKDRDSSASSDGGFAVAIAEAVALTRYGLAPALLASLKSDQAITLNYDELFEFAAEDAGDPRTVIPAGDRKAGKKWLLKLHGSVTDPESIVLTRDDYLGFNASREALSAIVKATLITHHLMFVGFGLADDHFHQIIHDVRRALPGGLGGAHGLATALTLRESPLDDRLWQGQLKLIPMTANESVVEAARTLEIFLDALLAHATDSHSYLLSSGYEQVLDQDDRALRASLLGMVESTDASQRSTASWKIIQGALESLGLHVTESAVGDDESVIRSSGLRQV